MRLLHQNNICFLPFQGSLGGKAREYPGKMMGQTYLVQLLSPQKYECYDIVEEPYDGEEEVKGFQVHWVLYFAVVIKHERMAIN